MSKENKTHSFKERGRDAYFSPRVAVLALLGIEGDSLPEDIYEPAVGAGNIAQELEAAGHTVYCADVHDYGYPGTVVEDYLTASPPPWVGGIVTNPPFRYAQRFVEKAYEEVPYVAMLGRIGYLESLARKEWLEKHPPSRIILPSRRLPMMHRLDWEGPLNSSNMCHPWFVWDKDDAPIGGTTQLIYYDWKNFGDGTDGRAGNSAGDTRVVKVKSGETDS